LKSGTVDTQCEITAQRDRCWRVL